ncbi:TPA: hypothetical protein ENX78_00870 [Candidatus Poribacteria bacterium]|nr:hypothetical protein [Candidatus Poribacteria bacterium]
MKYEKPKLIDLSEETFTEGACGGGLDPTGACKSGTLPQGNCTTGYNAINGGCINGPNPKVSCQAGGNK